MKNLKKLFAVLVAMTMAMMLAVPAFAAQPTTNHTFDIYQIFTGTPSAEGDTTVWSDLAWSNGVSNTFYAANSALAQKMDLANDTAVTPDAVATWLAGGAANQQAFATLAEGSLGTKYKTSTNGTVELDNGYYLVVDSTAELGTAARNPAILQADSTTGTYTIASKTDIPSVEKKIWEESLDDITHKDGAASNSFADYTSDASKLGNDQWNDVADYDIGDAVPFKLTASIPANTMTNYDEYHITFNDTYATGFAAPTNFKYYYQVGTGTIAEVPKNAITYTQGTNAFTAKIQMVGPKENGTGFITGANKASAVTVYVVYTAQLTSAVAAVGQENDVTLSYSNDYTGTGEGTTPKDTVVALTFDFDVNKYNAADASKASLAGATFKLYKVNGALPDDFATEANTNGVYDLKTTTNLTAVKFAAVGKTLTVSASGSETFTTTSTGNIVLHGLDTGNYILVETKAPAGFNTLGAGIPVTIATTGYERANYVASTYAIAKSYTVNGSTSVVSVANNKGATLPSTGGMGTTLFTILGIVLMGGAAVLLVAKRRTNK